MRKKLKKPVELFTCQTSAALSRLNNCLPFFPGGDEGSKFTQVEFLKILESSLPFAWRQKFDYDGYIPTDHNRAKFIASCEAIERNQESKEEEKKQRKNKHI